MGNAKAKSSADIIRAYLKLGLTVFVPLSSFTKINYNPLKTIEKFVIKLDVKKLLFNSIRNFCHIK